MRGASCSQQVEVVGSILTLQSFPAPPSMSNATRQVRLRFIVPLSRELLLAQRVACISRKLLQSIPAE
jgi:hypothetical protein